MVGALAGMTAENLGLESAVSYWGDVGLAAVIGAVVGAATWPILFFRYSIGALAAALALLWLVVAFTPFVGWLAAGVPRFDRLEKADAAYVFASGIQGNGDLTTISLSRLVHGLEVVGQGMAPILIVSDLAPPYPSYIDAATALRDRLGIRGEIVSVGEATNTHEESLSLARLCRERGWKRVIAVTSPYHSRRACSAAERAGVDVVCSPSLETRFEIDDLRFSKERRVAFSEILHERLGLWAYRRRGWLAEPQTLASNPVPAR